MKNGKLQIGFIGCGGIANGKHFPALKQYPELCEMVAFCDIVPERAEKAAKEYGTPEAKVYTDYNEMLKDEAIDVVHVLTPNVVHCPATVAAFKAGKHVMCEKPMAESTASAQKMIDAWKESGKMFTIGYQNRFRPEVQVLHKACEAGDLGEIYYAKAHALRRRAVPTWGVFPNKKLQGGGPLIDIGTHALDMTLWMMNNYKPASVTGSVFYKLGHDAEAAQSNIWGPWDPDKYEVEDSAFGFIKMENGATIVLESSWALNILNPHEAATTLCGTKAGAEMRSPLDQKYKEDTLVFTRDYHGRMTEEHLSPGGEVAFFGGKSTEAHVLEAGRWLKAVLGDGEPLVKPEQAFVVTQILEGIYKSAAAGKEVKFKKKG